MLKSRSSDCKELNEISCYMNQLTSLNLSGCKELSKLDCNGNQLTSLDFLDNLDPKKLTKLFVGDNNLSKKDLTIFDKFFNLEELWVGNLDPRRNLSGKHSHFYGSLEPLQNMNKLSFLNIINTSIDSGLEYLPASLETIVCGSYLTFNSSGKIKKELKKYVKEFDWNNYLKALNKTVYSFAFDYQAWRRDHQELIQKVQQTAQIQIPPK